MKISNSSLIVTGRIANESHDAEAQTTYQQLVMREPSDETDWRQRVQNGRLKSPRAT
jgi:hypothetical protein